jgi:predicted CXXCH cytochrome family protein
LPTSGCTDCHTVDGPWSNASFDHVTASGGFALIGKHDLIACTKCHDPTAGAALFEAQGDSDCFACHEDRWLVAHGQGGGTPTTCENCHTRNTWTEITFDHDSQFFPIYSGKHRGKWGSCSECHTIPSDFSVFNCLTCHAHNKTKMDDKHRGENGYEYTSSGCLDCHPRGNA